jgi:DNA replication licensing factor MCM5
MVLADGGIVCIDGIHKMRPADRVAIHEGTTDHYRQGGNHDGAQLAISVWLLPISLWTIRRFQERIRNIDLMTTILSRFGW